MFCNKPASRRRARALLRQGKLLQPEEGCQLTCEGLDASVAKGFASLDRIQAGKEMLVRIVAMLTKLMRFDPEQYRVHESAARPSCAIRARVSRKGGPFLGAA